MDCNCMARVFTFIKKQSMQTVDAQWQNDDGSVENVFQLLYYSCLEKERVTVDVKGIGSIW